MVRYPAVNAANAVGSLTLGWICSLSVGSLTLGWICSLSVGSAHSRSDLLTLGRICSHSVGSAHTRICPHSVGSAHTRSDLLTLGRIEILSRHNVTTTLPLHVIVAIVAIIVTIGSALYQTLGYKPQLAPIYNSKTKTRESFHYSPKNPPVM